MSFFIPLKNALEVEKSTIGQKALAFATVEQNINIPFSMVITTNVFDEFVHYNQLELEIDWYCKAPTVKEKLNSFERLTTAIKNAQFPYHVVDSLQECYELVSLDTNNLHKLSAHSDSKGLMMLSRSVNYDDSTNMTPSTMFTRETFKQFLETVKKIYIGSFVPSANLGSNPKIAVIITRVPDLQATVETECVFSENSLYVKSYNGFPDFFNVVEKDQFLLAIDFLKIKKSSIETQKRVIVFDSKENTNTIKEFSQGNTSQCVSDNIVLETGRLTKKIGNETKASIVKAKFFINKDQITCIDVDLKYDLTKPTQVTKIVEEPVYVEEPKENLDFTAPIVEEEKISLTDDHVFNPEKIKHFMEVVDETEVQNLIKSLISFMEKYKTREFAQIVPILTRSLEDPEKNSLIQTLELCKEIIRKFKDAQEE